MNKSKLQSEFIKLESKTNEFEPRFFTKLTRLIEIVQLDPTMDKIKYWSVYKKKYPFEYMNYKFSKIKIER